MAIGKYLFTIANNGVASPGLTQGANSAPALTPVNTNLPIDVINDFAWTNTANNGTARLDTPAITLKEYNVKRSSLYQQARYLLSSTPDVVGALQTVTKEINASNALIVGAAAGAIGGGPGIIRKAVGAIFGGALAKFTSSGAATAGAQDVQSVVDKAGLTSAPNTNLQPYLQPYDQLYATVPTGFQYVFPYFSGDWKQASTDWESLNGTTYNQFDSALKDVGSFFNEGGLTGKTGAGALRSFFPAAYFETPKMFKYSDGAENKIEVKFQLFNTTTVDDVIRNWQLCFLLMYQNRPNRASRVLVDVPAIYEINIPGILYCPFAFISSIAINQLGATRQMTIPISVSANTQSSSPTTVSTATGPTQVQTRPVGSQTTNNTTESSIVTLIPDVYEVSIQLTPLVAETKNLLYQTIANNKSIYDVSVLPSTNT